MTLDIKYVGGVAHPSYRKKELERKMTRFLETANLIRTKHYIIDVDNMFKRHFMCCSENCDFYVHHMKSQKGLFGGKDEIDWVDKGCCYNGSLEVPKDLEKRIDDNLEGILEFCEPECREQILKKGWKHKIGKEFVGVGSLSKDNRCLFTKIGADFTTGKGEMPLCALHAYALSKGMDVLDLKPFECFLYPLDFIEVDGKILITSIDSNGSTQNLLRWGDVHLAQGCQHKTEHGLPMYQYAKDVIIQVLGEKAWRVMDKLYKKGEWT